MHLPRHTLTSHADSPAFINAQFYSPSTSSPSPSFSGSSSSAAASAHGPDGSPSTPTARSRGEIFACATTSGFLVAQTCPLKVVARRDFPSAQGGLVLAAPVGTSSLLVLVGGGRVPRYAPNKVVLWDEAALAPAPSAPSIRPDAGPSTPTLQGSRRASTIFSAGSGFDTQRSSVSSPSSASEDEDEAQDKVASVDVSIPDINQSSISDLEGAPTPSKGKAWAQDLDDEPLLQSLTSRSAQSASRSDPSSNPPPDSSPTTSGPALADQDERGDLSESRYVRDSRSRRSFGSQSLSHSKLSTTAASHRDGTSERADEMAQSVASISASSANLDDPFGVPSPPPSPPARPPPASPQVAPTAFSGSANAPTMPQAEDEKTPAARLPPRRVQSSRSGFSHSARTGAPTALPRKGREVAELEFGEAVRGVCVRVFDVDTRSSSNSAHRSRQGGSVESAAASGSPRTTRVALLVVVLRKKALVFELGEEIDMGLQGAEAKVTGGEDAQITSGWGIRKRGLYETYENEKGLAALAPLPKSTSALLVLPGRQAGHAQLVRLSLNRSRTVIPVSGASIAGASTIIAAHSAPLAAITLSDCGTLLATASERGTLLRIWSTASGPTPRGAHPQQPGARTGSGAVLIRELRRGTDPAHILSMAFAPDSSALAAASDKGTIHIFRLNGEAIPMADGQGSASSTSGRGGGSGAPAPKSSQSKSFGGAAAKYLPASLSQLASAIPPSMLPQYFRSEWSAAQFRIPLRTFGAQASGARHPRSASRKRMDVEGRRGVGEEGIDTPTGGGAQSTEGAWAAMRSRIEDVRRGEAGTDERICLGWVMAPSKDDDASAGADAISDTGSAKSKLNPSPAAGGFDSPAAQRRRAAARSSLGVDTPRPTEHGANISAARNRSSAAPEYHLIALTTSGGWYRLSLSDVAESGAEEAGGGSDDGGSESDNGRRRSTVLDMYREDREGGEPGTGARSQHGQATGTGKGGKKRATRGAEGCSLEEYRRFGSSNEWV